MNTSYFERVKRFIASYFLFDQRRTTFTNEIRGGFVTFLTMSYILLVNPQILTGWVGGDKGNVYPDKKLSLLNNVASSTAAVCAIGTFLVGVVSNLPFAIGPGMGMNTFFAGTIVVAHTNAEYAASRSTWDLAVTTTFFTGLVILLASMFNLTQRLVTMLPTVLKSAILVGIGLYQAFVGLRTLNIIESDPTELLKFVSHYDFSDTASSTGTVAQILFAMTLFITAALYVLEVNGAILVGISVTTVVAWIFSLGGVSFPKMPIQVPMFSETFWNFAFKEFFSVQWIGTCVSFVLITLFDVGGIMFGVMTLVHKLIREGALVPVNTDPSEDYGGDDVDDANAGHRAVEDESLISHHPEIIAPWEARRAFIVVGISSMVSAVLGCSPCIIFLECIAGVASGSRTGFSAVVTALCFLLSLPFVPLFRSVPSCASSPALVIIGCFMMSSASEIPWHDHKMAMPAFLTIAMMPFTASITPGIVIGIISYTILHGVAWLQQMYKAWRGTPGGSTGAGLQASPLDVEAQSQRSAASKVSSSHTHSLGYNVDEPHHGSVGFRPRGGATHLGMYVAAEPAASGVATVRTDTLLHHDADA